MKAKRIAKVILAGALVAEGAVADWALLQIVRNGFEVEISESELIKAGRAARADMENEGEKMLTESVVEGLGDE